MRKFYILYDGRALTQGTDSSAILETLGSRFTQGDFNRWAQHDAVLYAYDVDEHARSLANEVLIGHMAEGYEVLQGRL